MRLRYLKNKKGQVVTAEYVMVFFLVVTVMMTMTVYIKRALQARVFAARNTMAEMVAKKTKAEVYYEYEPYNTQSDANVFRGEATTKHLKNGAFSKDINSSTNVTSKAQVLDPSFAK